MFSIRRRAFSYAAPQIWNATMPVKYPQLTISRFLQT